MHIWVSSVDPVDAHTTTANATRLEGTNNAKSTDWYLPHLHQMQVQKIARLCKLIKSPVRIKRNVRNIEDGSSP